MHINVSKKILIAAIFFAAFCSGMFFLAVFPLLADIEKYGLRVREQRDKILGYGNRVAVAREFDVFAQEQNNNFDKIAAVFANADMPLGLIDSLETAARDAGVEIKLSRSSLSRKNDGDWPSIVIGADVSGDAGGILRFMKKIESSPYLVEAQSVDIEIGESQKKAIAVTKSATGTQESAIEPGAEEVFLPVQAHVLLKVYVK